MYAYNRKKEIIKNTVYITFILLIAVVSTYFIYNKFQKTRTVDFNSDSLDVSYHEASGDRISINKVTPVTDSVGLSSKAYTISVKNNLTENVHYKVKVLVDYGDAILGPQKQGNIIEVSEERFELLSNPKANPYNVSFVEKVVETAKKEISEKVLWLLNTG